MTRSDHRIAAIVLFGLGLGVSGCSPSPSTQVDSPPARTIGVPVVPTQWRLLRSENFESISLPRLTWAPNAVSETDRFADHGDYFLERDSSFIEPVSFRASAQAGSELWLQLEAYTRDEQQDLRAFFSIEQDPADPGNHVLRLATPRHTNGAIVRSARPLPPEYKVCARAGFADYGTGYLDPAHNGYNGDERATPWLDMRSEHENGFYWLAILDAEPRPRNNVWIHHHRKVVIDSDNNWYPASDGGPWSWIWNGAQYVQSGEHPIMMFALDATHPERRSERTGLPFISWSRGQWNSEVDTHQIRAVDAYREREWYRVCIEKTTDAFRLSMSGRFRFGGETVYDGTISRALVNDPLGSPDYFFFGDPHINFYRGQVYFDDLQLFVPER